MGERGAQEAEKGALELGVGGFAFTGWNLTHRLCFLLVMWLFTWPLPLAGGTAGLSQSAASAFLVSDLTFLGTAGRTPGCAAEVAGQGELAPARCSALQRAQGSHLPAFLEAIAPSLV